MNGQEESHLRALSGRIFAVVEELIEVGKPIGPNALAKAVGIDRSSVGRILGQLTDIGIVERSVHGYIVGPRLFSLSQAVVSMDTLTNAAMPILRELSGQFNETCYLCKRYNDSGVLITGVESTKSVRYVVEPNRPFPLYAGAPGRAILSGMPHDELVKFAERTPLKPVTANTVTDSGRLLELAKIDRAAGFSVGFGERIEGGFAVASPYFADDGWCLGSVVFTCPLSRLEHDRIPEYGKAVKVAADALSARLGYRVLSPSG